MKLESLKLVNFQIHHNEKGKLVPFYFEDFDFSPVRSFLVTDVPKGETRGYHAHRNTHQVLICISGKISIKIDNGKWSSCEALENFTGVIQRPMEWSEIKFLEDNSSLLVFSSSEYDESDYIRDYETFLLEAQS